MREAPSIIVTTLDDVVDPFDGLISLREAIEVYFAWQTDDNGKVVTSARKFAKGTDGYTVTFDFTDYIATNGGVAPSEYKITLTNDPDVINHHAWNQNITIKNAMTIDATNVKLGEFGTRKGVTVDGGGASQIFSVANALTADDTVTFKYLTQTNTSESGVAISSYGNAAIKVENGTFTKLGNGVVAAGTIEVAYSNFSEYRVNAISSTSSSVTVSNTTITGISGTSAYGVLATNDVTITGGVIKNNARGVRLLRRRTQALRRTSLAS